ncbi:hypothetical protein BD309DRAFT_667954 [Dichomitus squalens]|nr:hypothetical protein BD309DRAFT_667954 [Dichomitus squalens]
MASRGWDNEGNPISVAAPALLLYDDHDREARDRETADRAESARMNSRSPRRKRACTSRGVLLLLARVNEAGDGRGDGSSAVEASTGTQPRAGDGAEMDDLDPLDAGGGHGMRPASLWSVLTGGDKTGGVQEMKDQLAGRCDGDDVGGRPAQGGLFSCGCGCRCAEDFGRLSDRT